MPETPHPPTPARSSLPAPRISIVIPTYDRLEQVQETVASILRQLRTGDEIIVVDNSAAEQRYTQLAAVFEPQGVRLLREPRTGASYARNRGAQDAAGEVIAFLDDDIVAPPHWVETLRTIFQTDRYDCVGGSALFPPELTLPEWFPARYSYLFGETNFGSRARDLDGKELLGSGNMAFRRETFFAVGGFPVTLGRRGGSLAANEDIFICRATLQHGGRIGYLPELTVRHWISSDRLTVSHMLRSAYTLGRSDATIDLATHGRRAYAIRCILKIARIAVEGRAGIWPSHRRGPAWAEHAVRVAMLRGYLGLARPRGSAG